MYIRHDLSHNIIFVGHLNFECIVVSLNVGVCKVCVVCYTDLPVVVLTSLTICNDILCTLDVSLFSNFFTLGDFNIDFLSQTHPLFSKLFCISSSFLLLRVVSHPTHFSHLGVPSIIDLAFVSCLYNLISCTTIPPLSNSDHMGIAISYNLPTNNKRPRTAPRSVWCYSLGDFDKACELLENVDWDAITKDSDVDTCWNNWQHNYLSIIKECIPQKVLSRRKHLPWISLSILKAIKRRNFLLNKYHRTGNQHIFLQYKHVRNGIISELRKSKHAFFEQLQSTDDKTFWKLYKVITRKKSSIPVLRRSDINLEPVRDDLEKQTS